MTSSNFVGCSTGRSAGLVPLRILSTYIAAVSLDDVVKKTLDPALSITGGVGVVSQVLPIFVSPRRGIEVERVRRAGIDGQAHAARRPCLLARVQLLAGRC